MAAALVFGGRSFFIVFLGQRDARSDMEATQLTWIANFIGGSAADVLRDLYVRQAAVALPAEAET